MKESLKNFKEIVDSVTDGDLLLDVRSAEEYDEGHIHNSVNIEYTDIEKHVEDLAKYNNIVVFCRSGKRCQIACGLLQQNELNNFTCITNSGMQDWTEAGLDVE